MAKAAGYELCLSAADRAELHEAIKDAQRQSRTCFIEVLVALGSRNDLGRPTTTPKENKDALMSYLKEGELT